MGKSRRRGTELEAAIYTAARQILKADGLDGLSFGKVAIAAGTSKPVIYRRFDSPADLAIAAIQDQIRQDNHGTLDQMILTGTTLREDIVQLLHRFMRSTTAFNAPYLRQLFMETGASQRTHTRQLFTTATEIDLRAVDQVLERAKQRGEALRAPLTDDAKLLPFIWLRYQIFLTDDPITDEVLAHLIDHILLPVWQG